MNNEDFLQIVSYSFIEFLRTSARSNKKLKILHGAIANDIKNKLGDGYNVYSLGYGNGKEAIINGRYIDKRVDIVISKDRNILAGIGVKFVMNNYSQNSNNYFESMLGETANIRANKKKYFQIFIMPEKVPYYNNRGEITKWEQITIHNIDKYVKLSNDNADVFFHTPIKTLIFIIKLPNPDNSITNKEQYKKYYLSIGDIKSELSTNISNNFGETVILNDYEDFIKKLVFYIKSI
jgi:hypothetical protein